MIIFIDGTMQSVLSCVSRSILAIADTAYMNICEFI